MVIPTKPNWKPTRRVLILLALILLTLGGVWSWLTHDARQRALDVENRVQAKVTERKRPLSLPKISFDLINHKHEATTHKDFPGKFLLVAFGYTSCPDVCPTTLQNLATAMARLKSEKEGDAVAAQIQPLFVTVDPGRDSADILAEYVSVFDDRLIGLTGSVAQIEDATKKFRVFTRRPSPEEVREGDYFVDHSAYTYLVSPNGRIIDYYPHDTTPTLLAKSIVSNLAEFNRRSKGQ